MTLYEILNDIVRNLPPGPHRYDLHCHPGVLLRLRSEYSPPPAYNEYAPPFMPSMPLYGTVDIMVRDGYEPGQWRLYENGVLRKSGRLTD